MLRRCCRCLNAVKEDAAGKLESGSNYKGYTDTGSLDPEDIHNFDMD